MVNPSAPGFRNASLDTLRGIAILLVLIGHYLAVAPYQVAGAPIGDFVADFGHGGVLLFFMLSGYLIWTKAHDHDAAVFLLRRFAKIAPAYWINVLFVAMAGALLPFFPAFGLKDTFGNLLFMEGMLGVEALSGVYWTLVIEVKFYLLFALLFFTPLRRLFWLVPPLVLALNLALYAWFGRASTLLIYRPVFFIGAAIAAAERGRLPSIAIPVLAAAAMAGLIVAAPFRGWQAAVFLAADVALFLAVYRSGLHESRIAWLGVISYSVYLYHTTLGFPILAALSAGMELPWPAALGVAVIAVGAVSWLSFKQVETRFVRAARRLEPDMERGAIRPLPR